MEDRRFEVTIKATLSEWQMEQSRMNDPSHNVKFCKDCDKRTGVSNTNIVIKEVFDDEKNQG